MNGLGVQRVAGELEAVVERAAERLRAVDEAEAGRSPAPGKWSTKEIVGHLIDSAANNHQRFVRAQQAEALSFPKYEQEAWVSVQAYAARPWAELVELWRLYNRHLAHVMRQIRPEKLGVPCTIGSNAPVTLGYLVEDYLAHLKHHLRQLGLE